MCGIAGIIDPREPPTAELLERMGRPLTQRGPDAVGYFDHGEVGLVHRRLSIIDIDGGRQPMFNEDRNLVIVFNGEIYGYGNIRETLIAKGHNFTTASDTEVLLHLYEEEGPDMLKSLNGMYALAIYDMTKQELFLARDRFGQKPLFYAQAGNRFAFASGPRSLLPLSWIDTSIDRNSIHDYLEYQYIPTPRSIYTGISKIPPGSYGMWNGEHFTIRKFWTPTITGNYDRGYPAANIELRQKLTAAVTTRLVADVPVGVFLSGGVDSSIVAALAQSNVEQPVHTFSIGFPEKKYDERSFAKIVANHLGTKHHFLEVIPGDFDHLITICQKFEEPFCDASMLPTAMLSHFTRQHVKVALSGDGADELFGGYYRYRVIHLCRMFRHCHPAFRRSIRKLLLSILPPKIEERTFWGRLRRLIEISDVDGIEQYLKIISRCPDELKKSTYGDRMTGHPDLPDSINVLQSIYTGTDNRLLTDEIMEIDLRSYLNDDILVKVDRASMAYGLEVRSPFLDVHVAELALKCPYHWKQQGNIRKMILTETCQDLLPAEIFKRSKMGFGVPLARWLRKEWKESARMYLLEGKLVQEAFFRRDRLESVLQRHQNREADYSYFIFALIVLELWLQENTKN